MILSCESCQQLFYCILHAHSLTTDKCLVLRTFRTLVLDLFPEPKAIQHLEILKVKASILFELDHPSVYQGMINSSWPPPSLSLHTVRVSQN